MFLWVNLFCLWCTLDVDNIHSCSHSIDQNLLYCSSVPAKERKKKPASTKHGWKQCTVENIPKIKIISISFFEKEKNYLSLAPRFEPSRHSHSDWQLGECIGEWKKIKAITSFLVTIYTTEKNRTNNKYYNKQQHCGISLVVATGRKYRPCVLFWATQRCECVYDKYMTVKQISAVKEHIFSHK